MDCCDNSLAMGRVVCPKPRRVGPSNFNNSVAPLRFHIRNDAVAFDSKPGAELLDLILRKEGYEAERCSNVSSSPPFFFGSPPCRAPNPIVQDAHFRVEKLPTTVSSPSDSAALPSAHSRAKFGNKQAAVRVEGFDCQSSCFVAMAYNS
ncbi:hypothetical protein DH2020_037747 [Rehmannia glutinosa]|uniref:Uncharacterized protein n=1 Tax=Rehmannia glutinosa TaxID=99300 RepID=A0ABR0V0J3_REHGL